jgi:uncharacterized membrane protein YkoI
MKRNIVIATVAAAALIGAGTVTAFATGDDDSAPTQRQTDVRVADDRDDTADDRDGRDDATVDRDDDATEVRSDIRAAKVSAADAIAAALKHTPGTAVAADRDDDGSRAWEVDVVKGDGTEYTVRVAPDAGKVLGAQRDRDGDDGREDLAALKGTSVDAREAATAAGVKGTVTDVDLGDDRRAAVWSVETTKGEWTVDAHTGKVTQDRDNDHDGDDD